MDLVGPLYCKVCNVAIPHENARENHNQGKRHQLALHAAYLEDHDEKASVFSIGWPNAIPRETILDFMASFGKISSHYMAPNRSWMITKYEDIGVAQDLIKIKHTHFYGKRVNFQQKKRSNNAQFQPPPPEEESKFDTILKIIHNQKSFGDEILSLCVTLQPNYELDIQKYLQLCADLEMVLRNIYRDARVHPFGSTITGLAFPTSDVDAYIEVPHPPRYVNKTFYVEAVNQSRDILGRSALFTNIVSIPRAKTPIVKCVHIPTGLKCDFNFKNMLGVCNSYFIQYVVRLHPNIKRILLVLKFWAKVRFYGGNNARLTNYAITVIFIYYLQQPPYNLPSIRKYQENPASRNMQHGWNGGFNSEMPINLYAIMNASLYDLLLGFFTFCLSINYADVVICPYLGKTLDRDLFTEEDKIPAEFQHYRKSFRDQHLKTDSPMCLQDPFEHNHNLTGALSKKFVEEYIAELKIAVEVMTAQKPHLLHTLCSDSVDIVQHYTRIKLPKLKSLQFIIEENKLSGDQLSYEIKIAWFKMVDQFLLDILADVFMFTVTDSRDEDSHSNPKKMRPSIMDDLHSTTEYTASGKLNLWEARNLVKHIVFSTILERQVGISKYIKETLLKDVTSTASIVQLKIIVEHFVMDTHIIISLQSIDSDEHNYFSSFAACFLKNFNGWLAVYTKEKNQPYFIVPKETSGETSAKPQAEDVIVISD